MTLVTILYTIIVFLIAKSCSEEEGKQEEGHNDNKIWLFKDGKDSKYVYTISSDTNRSINLPTTRPETIIGQQEISPKPDYDDKTKSETQLDDQETSGSILKSRHFTNTFQRANQRTQELDQEKQTDKKSQLSLSQIDSKQQAKRGKLKFFNKGQSKRISLTALLPKSKRQDSSNLRAGSSLNRPLIDPFFSTGAPSQTILPYGAANHHLLFAPQLAFSGFDQTSPSTNHHQYQQHQHPSFNSFNFPQLNDPFSSGNSLIGHRQTQTGISTQMPIDQHAAQSIENYRRIRLSQNQQSNEMPIIYAAGDDNGEQNGQVGKMNHFKVNPPNKTTLSLLSGSSQQWTSTLGPSLLGERAKNLMSHISLNGNKNNFAVGDSSSSPTIDGAIKSASNSVGLANMIKSAADAWASSNTQANMPTIVVENDGPTLTSVDFGANLPVQRVIGSDTPENEDLSTFYNEESEETESEGSNEARKIARLKQAHQHPFGEQQLNSNPILSELDFYDTQEPEFGHNNNNNNNNDNVRPRKRIRKGDYSNDAVQDYMRLQKIIDHPQSYPDSINAIKEQNNFNHNNNNNNNDHRNINLASNLRDKLGNGSPVSNDQIEQLIKELRELNSKRKSRNSQSDDSNSNSNNNKRIKATTSALDDYDDLFGNDDDEDEQTRLLRKKLLARLRSKHERSSRQGNQRDSTSFHNEAVKIPLHALLLAALDRRMSPSEQRSQTTAIQDLIADERNRNVVASGQQDFNEVTSGLGTLMNTNNLYDSLDATQPQTYDDNLTFASPVNQNDNNFNSSSPKQGEVNDSTAASFKISSNDSIHGGYEGEIKTNSGDDLSHGRKGDTDRVYQDDLEQTSSATTRTPSRVMDKANASDQEPSLKRTLKGRRAIADRDEGDFDVNKQINDYSQDKDDQALEPSWVHGRRTGKGSSKTRRPHPSAVDFDDDFEHLDKATRQKILRANKAKARRKLNEAEFEANENSFIDKIHKDTSDSSSSPDIDQSISKIEEPAEEEQRRTSGKSGSKSAPTTNEDNSGEDDIEEGSDDGDAIENSNKVNGDDNKDGKRVGAESKTVESSTWKPQMIDEEVRKLEELANRKRRKKGGSQARSNDYNSYDYESKNDDDPSQRYEEAMESRNHVTTVQPHGITNVSIDSNGTVIYL